MKKKLFWTNTFMFNTFFIPWWCHIWYGHSSALKDAINDFGLSEKKKTNPTKQITTTKTKSKKSNINQVITF